MCVCVCVNSFPFIVSKLLLKVTVMLSATISYHIESTAEFCNT